MQAFWVEKSTVTVNGDVDMTVCGNGVTTNADGQRAHRRRRLHQVPAAMKYSYYATCRLSGRDFHEYGEMTGPEGPATEKM